VEMFCCVKKRPHISSKEGLDSIHAMAKRIRESEEAQEQAEEVAEISRLVSSCTLPHQKSHAGRGRQMAHSKVLSRRERDT